MQKLKLVEVENTDTGITLIDSQVYTEHLESDFEQTPGEVGPVRFGIRVMYTEHYDTEWAKSVGKYHVSVHATAVGSLSEQTVKSMLRYGSIGADEWAAVSETSKAALVIEYGTHATLWQNAGSNLKKLLAEARKELRIIKSFTFGFAMDRNQNRIGATGWDFIVGNIEGRKAV